jgi:hypothetical protein
MQGFSFPVLNQHLPDYFILPGKRKRAELEKTALVKPKEN